MTKILLAERDIDILTSISNLRFMTSRQIHALHGYEGKYGSNVTRRKLLGLEKANLVNAWQPSKYDQKVFYLTQTGAQEVESFHGYKNIKTYRKSDKTLHHTLVSEIYVRLRLEKEGKLRAFALDYRVDEVVADAFVQYGIGQRRKLFFLEADRGTESMSYIRMKLDGYNRVCTSGLFQRKYGIFPDVVFVTTADNRQRSLAIVGEKYPYRVRVLTEREFVARPMCVV